MLSNTLRGMALRRQALLLAACAVLAARMSQAFSTSYLFPSPTCQSQSGRRNVPQHSSGLVSIAVKSSRLEVSGEALDYIDEEEEHSRGPNIVVIKTHEDYIEFLEEDDRLCVIKFYANWCKSCQRFGARFRHLAFDEGDRIDAGVGGAVYHAGAVRFAEAEYSASAKLCKSLRVRKLPTVHMYKRGRGKVADMCVKPSQFQLVVDEMHRLLEEDSGAVVATVTEFPSGVTELEKEFEAKLRAGGKLGVDIRSNTTSTLTSFDKDDGVGTSFDETMKTGSSLADEIMTSLRPKEKTKEDSSKKEKSWFPFTF